MFSTLNVILNEPCANSCGRPIANNTCEGSNVFELQADPVEQHMLYLFKCNTMDSPSINSKLKFILFGSLLSIGPFNLQYGISLDILSIQ